MKGRTDKGYAPCCQALKEEDTEEGDPEELLGQHLCERHGLAR